MPAYPTLEHNATTFNAPAKAKMAAMEFNINVVNQMVEYGQVPSLPGQLYEPGNPYQGLPLASTREFSLDSNLRHYGKVRKEKLQKKWENICFVTGKLRHSRASNPAMVFVNIIRFKK